MNKLGRGSFVYIVYILIINCLDTGLSAQNSDEWKASKRIIESLSRQNSEINYYEEKVPYYTLPDILTSLDGTKVTNADTWNRIRRNEILELFRENVYGRVPYTPYEKSFKVVNLDKNAINGTATLKQVDITIRSGGKQLIIHLTIFTPNSSDNPVPAFLLINNRGPANSDPTRKEKSEFWPVEEAIARGYGMAVFNNSDVAPDKFDDFKSGIYELLDKKPRPDDAWGALAAWAWGASRCMDYMVTDKEIDAGKVTVIGHSRGGKAALWAGAQDTRFAMVVSNESGCGGSSLARRRYGETVERINSVFPHWFCNNFKKFNKLIDSLPVDFHMLAALIAPRPLYVANASDDLWADPRGSYLSVYHAMPVYKLLGADSGIPESMPSLNKQVINGKAGYHIREGGHNMLLSDWIMFMNFSDTVFKK